MKQRLLKIMLFIFMPLAVIALVIYVHPGGDILLEQVSMIDPVTESMLETSRISEYSDIEFIYLKKLAEMGHKEVYYELGRRYVLATGVVEDKITGYRYINMAVDSGDVKAMEFMGYMYDAGSYVYVREPEKALYWYTLAAEHGSAAGAYHLCANYISKTDYTEALGWCKYSADKGYPASQITVGFMYARGKGVEQNMELAEKYICMAKENGRINRHALEQYKISCE